MCQYSEGSEGEDVDCRGRGGLGINWPLFPCFALYAFHCFEELLQIVVLVCTVPLAKSLLD
jgi:hypothetical protein